MADVRPGSTTSAAASASKAKNSNGFWVNLIIVLVCIVLGFVLFEFVLGSSSNFEDAEKKIPTSWMGNMYHAGYIVALLLAMLFITIVFVIERGITIIKAKGKFNGAELVRKVQYHLANKNIDAAIAECDKQAGSVGNVMKAGLKKYKEMTFNTELSTDQKVLSIKKELEEATALELPMLDKNLVFLSTITSSATLLGLIGTVIGMIKAFAAMGAAGAPDASQIAIGISEALWNTATGISTSFIAMIMYNFYTTLNDGIGFSIDEGGFTLTQSFAANYK
ncbi:MAG: flagellar motor protein MotA [Bacteroidetes bacterium 47-18]|nr:MAG: flagellar motor protein MotA [Bacteroidetes bacterium 47-18]